MACVWMGVGCVNFSCSQASQSSSRTPRSANVFFASSAFGVASPSADSSFLLSSGASSSSASASSSLLSGAGGGAGFAGFFVLAGCSPFTVLTLGGATASEVLSFLFLRIDILGVRVAGAQPRSLPLL